MTNCIEPQEIAGHLKPGMTVFIGSCTAEPAETLDVLRGGSDCCAGVRFVCVTVPGINKIDFSTLHPEAKSTAFFALPENRENIASGRIDFLPMQYRAIYTYLERDVDIDMAIVQLPEPDVDGTMSLGVTVDFLPAVLDKAKIIVGEINDQQPAPKGSPTMRLDQLDLVVKCSRAVTTVPAPHMNGTVLAIAGHVADLINDGDCLQTGIGAIPSAALAALFDKNDLGFHSGMLADGAMALIKAGNANGAAKNIDKGQAVFGATLGSAELIEWAGQAENLLFRPVTYTHDTDVVRRNDNFVSINSALQVDLFGQVNADMLDGAQISGTGGSVDLMRSAALSKGGRSILALNATAAKGSLSRIIPALPANTAATALRTDIDYVVTEYGAKRIRHLPFPARAEALIELAAPEFRDGLKEAWREANFS